jgi:hypothetical protein
MARIVALMAAALLAAAPAATSVAAAPPPEPQQSPFQQAPRQNQVGEQPTTQAPASAQTQADDGSIGAGQGLLIGAGIVALIGGIWFVIARDARRVTAGRVPSADGSPGGSATRASRRSRRLSAAERRRRKRGRAAK